MCLTSYKGYNFYIYILAFFNEIIVFHYFVGIVHTYKRGQKRRINPMHVAPL